MIDLIVLPSLLADLLSFQRPSAHPTWKASRKRLSSRKLGLRLGLGDSAQLFCCFRHTFQYALMVTRVPLLAQLPPLLICDGSEQNPPQNG
jgi:hypothetical protein